MNRKVISFRLPTTDQDSVAVDNRIDADYRVTGDVLRADAVAARGASPRADGADNKVKE